MTTALWNLSLGGGGSFLENVVEDTTPQLGGNLDVNGNKIVSVSNGNIDIEPDGTGNVLLGNLTFDADQTVGAGQDNYVLTYDNGTGLVSLEAAAAGGISNVVEDTTPQLGGNLDVNGNKIVSVSNGDIDIEPNGTGNVLLGNYKFDADQTVGAGQDNYVLTYDNATGLINLEAAASGNTFDTDDFVNSGGTISLNGVGFRAYRTSVQTSVASGSWVKMQLNLVSWDTEGDYDNSTNYRYTASIAGTYVVTASTEMSTSSDTDVKCGVSIFKNGSIVSSFIAYDDSTSGSHLPRAVVADLVQLNGSTDYIESYVTHDAGSARSMTCAANKTNFSAWRIGP